MMMAQIDPAPPFVLTQDQGPVRRLILNRGPQRNPLSKAMMDALEEALASALGQPSVRVIVIAAEGPAFCAGHDLKELRAHRNDPDRGAAFYAALFSQCGRLMSAITNSPKPVIAEINGIATAAGCQLVASCDMALATITARFATPGVNIGLFCSTPMVALTRAVPRKVAMEMLLTGEMIDAAAAQSYGLINRIHAPDELKAAVDTLAQSIAAKSAATLAFGKRSFQEQMDQSLSEAYATTARIMTDNMLAADAEIGIGAFLDKGHPEWQDR
jgi:enoyl-CoA hydratase/carnithine racemase